MTKPDLPRVSWWVGLSREDLDREIAKRADEWKKKQIGPLDGVGERLRDAWDFK